MGGGDLPDREGRREGEGGLWNGRSGGRGEKKGGRDGEREGTDMETKRKWEGGMERYREKEESNSCAYQITWLYVFQVTG